MALLLTRINTNFVNTLALKMTLNGTSSYATWVHVILREASFHVDLAAAGRWPIVTATVIFLQD